MLRLAALLAALAPLTAQVNVGVTGGTPLSHFILNQRAGSRGGFASVTSAPRRYTVGPFLEFRVRGAMGLEAGALYKRFGFDTVSRVGGPAGPITSINSRTTGNSVEFPILVKAHLRLVPGANWFLSAGPSIRRLTGIEETGVRTVRTLFTPPERVETVTYETDSPVGLNRRWSFGVAAGAGLEFRAGPLRLAPEMRLTRWDTERTSSVPSASRLARTQAEALLSVGYAAGPEPAPARLPCCFELGLLAGIPLLAASEVRPAQSLIATTTIDAPTRRYVVGALLDWRFHPRLSLEASFLVRRFGHTETNVFSNFSRTESLSGYAWEAPLLLRWRASRVGPVILVVGGGPALRRASHIDWVFADPAASFKLDGSFINRTAIGAAVSGGLEFLAGRARLRPELRYEWFERPLYDFPTIQSRQDALHVVLGVSLASHSQS